MTVTTVFAQCPDITNSSISPPACANSCLLCPGDEITITVDGFDLPDPGTVDFYFSNNPGFDPYLGQGTFMGSANISTPDRLPCDECPTIEAIMVNACGNESANEFIVMSSGSGFNVDDLSISLPNGGFCGFGPPNTGLVSGCAVVGVGPGGMVPAGAIVVIFVSSNADQTYDFSGSCTNGETIYVLQNSCPLAQPGFRNSCMGCGTRTTSFSLSCGCSGSLVYLPEDLMDVDGEYVDGSGSPGQVTCPSGPPVSVSPPTPIESTVQPFSYIIPNNWCDQGPREIVGILNPAPMAPCTNQYTFRFTVEVRCPEANPASAEACDNGNGTATFDLDDIAQQVNGGSNIQVNWYSDMAGNNPINSPYTTSSTTVYATVLDGCESDPVAVSLTVLPLPVANAASDQACDEGNGEATFPLTNLSNQINGGSGNEVRFYLDPGATVQLLPPYTTSSTTIYAAVFDGMCESEPVLISLTVLPPPPAQSAMLEECDDGSMQATFDLDALINVVNIGTSNQVSWFADAALTIPISSPYRTGSTTIYAVVSDGRCNAQPVEITLTVKPSPPAFPTQETNCDDGSGMATFDLTALDGRVTGGAPGSVSYYLTPNGTQPLPSPFPSRSRIIYARVIEDGCESQAVPVELRVLPAPSADTASMVSCADSLGAARFDLENISDLVNLGSGFSVEWSLDSQFTQIITPPLVSGSTSIYARVFNGGCYSPFVEITLRAIPGPRLDLIPDTIVCREFILPAISGSGLSGQEAYYWMPGGQGDTLFPGDTLRMDTSIYVYDQNLSGTCADQQILRISIRTPLDAGNDRAISICEGAEVNLYTALDSADRGGRFIDLDMSGRLSDSLFSSAGLNGMSFRFQYKIDSIAPCPDDSSTVTLQVVRTVNAGADIRDTVCSDTRTDLFGLLSGADLGGSFTVIDQGPSVQNGIFDTRGAQEGEYLVRYFVGDGITCPRDSADIFMYILESPSFNTPSSLQGCGEVILPPFPGLSSGSVAGYYTGPGATGTQLFPGDTVRTSGQYFIWATNGPCSVEASFTISISGPSSTTINATFCEGEGLLVGNVLFDENNPSGTVVFPGGAANGCDSVVNVSLQINRFGRRLLNDTLCRGDFYEINGSIYDQDEPTGREVLPGASSNGCDSIVVIDLHFFPDPVEMVQANLCPGGSITINGQVFDANNPSGRDTLPGASLRGCDSIVVIELSFYPAATSEIRSSLCPGEFLIVNGTRYDETNRSGTEVITGASANGCDSTIVIALDYFAPATSRVERDLCFGQQITVNGRVYDENNPNGTEVIPGGSVNGCDSIISVALRFSDASYNTVRETLCIDEFLVINQTRYDVSNPAGSDTLSGASAAGCDSIIIVELSFFPEAQGTYTDTLCSDDEIFIGGVRFSANNPTGSVRIPGASVNGCDSTIAVSLDFTGGLLELTPQFTLAPGQSVNIDARFSGNIRRISWSPAEGLSCTDCLTPTASPNRTTQYILELEDDNGCLYYAATNIRIEENFKVFLPNAFSPNDDGVNDRFTIMTSDQVDRILYMRIFDRWGNLVYSEENVSPSSQRGWDGTYGNKLLDPAVFVVVAAVEFTGGKVQYFQRDLTLLR